MKDNEKLKVMMGDAQKLHGHLSPFLVIGVRMGMIAKRALGVADGECTCLNANVKIPLVPPFSCLLDGIQAATTCTVGNRRLTMENSEEIRVSFSRQGSNRTVKITLKPKMAEELKKKLSEDALTEEIARKIAGLPENRIFNIAIEY